MEPSTVELSLRLEKHLELKRKLRCTFIEMFALVPSKNENEALNLFTSREERIRRKPVPTKQLFSGTGSRLQTSLVLMDQQPQGNGKLTQLSRTDDALRLPRKWTTNASSGHFTNYGSVKNIDDSPPDDVIVEVDTVAVLIEETKVIADKSVFGSKDERIFETTKCESLECDETIVTEMGVETTVESVQNDDIGTTGAVLEDTIQSELDQNAFVDHQAVTLSDDSAFLAYASAHHTLESELIIMEEITETSQANNDVPSIFASPAVENEQVVDVSQCNENVSSPPSTTSKIPIIQIENESSIQEDKWVDHNDDNDGSQNIQPTTANVAASIQSSLIVEKVIDEIILPTMESAVMQMDLPQEKQFALLIAREALQVSTLKNTIVEENSFEASNSLVDKIDSQQIVSNAGLVTNGNSNWKKKFKDSLRKMPTFETNMNRKSAMFAPTASIASINAAREQSAVEFSSAKIIPVTAESSYVPLPVQQQQQHLNTVKKDIVNELTQALKSRKAGPQL